MKETTVNVNLLTMTPEAQKLIYTAFRQCYSKLDASDIFQQEIQADKLSKFIADCVDSGHYSPLEHVSFTFAISGVSRSCTHQAIRHRFLIPSQQSQRYVSAENFGFIVPPAIAKNKDAHAVYMRHMEETANVYRHIEEMLRRDGRGELAKEDARMVLTQATTSSIVGTMNCRALLEFFSKRCCTRAQWEIRNMANQMLAICREKLPVVFEKAGAKCEKLGYCPEGVKFCCGRYEVKNELS